jgi:hypothetical protein
MGETMVKKEKLLLRGCQISVSVINNTKLLCPINRGDILEAEGVSAKGTTREMGEGFGRCIQCKLGKVGQRVEGSNEGRAMRNMEFNAIAQSTGDAMNLVVDLGTEEPNSGFRDVKTGKLDDMSVASFVFDRPPNGSFTLNLVLSRQIANQHFA